MRMNTILSLFVNGALGIILTASAFMFTPTTWADDSLDNSVSLVGDQQMVHDPVAEIRREHLARLRPVGDEAHRAPRAVAAIAKLGLQCEQVGLGIQLEGERVGAVALVAPAAPVVAP